MRPTDWQRSKTPGLDDPRGDSPLVAGPRAYRAPDPTRADPINCDIILFRTASEESRAGGRYVRCDVSRIPLARRSYTYII